MANQQLEGNMKDGEMQMAELERKVMELEVDGETKQESISHLKKELASSKDEIKKKVNQLTQVNNMKKMIVDKNN